jgi:hypothetical protein
LARGAQRVKIANRIGLPKTVINILFAKMGLTDAHLSGG